MCKQKRNRRKTKNEFFKQSKRNNLNSISYFNNNNANISWCFVLRICITLSPCRKVYQPRASDGPDGLSAFCSSMLRLPAPTVPRCIGVNT